MENAYKQIKGNLSIIEVLKNDTHQKKIAIKGKFNRKNAIIVLSRKSFSSDILELKQKIFNEETIFELKDSNDKECHFEVTLTNETNDIDATIKCPAEDKEFKEFKLAEYWFIEETPELYKNVTLPFINEKILPKDNLKWVYDLLSGKKEQERTLHIDKDESTGYVLVKDSKWRSKEISEMHYVAFTQQKLMTIRDLNETHLPLLKKIKKEGTEIITKKYPVLAANLRIYFLYLPRFYHLHVHFITNTADDAITMLDRMHLLSTVINNIELMPDYYQKATLGIRHCYKSPFYYYQNYLNKKEAAEIKPTIKK
ncbi:m7GpppX diphosphatase-like [Cotesia glomerata]|uniref:m7GpppX diphosphatase n=1 Tax=Cotesia glomerata TaxID=32391 RepID=A0AAV7IAN6_COTGL|nr:m7GpppX diphosphatase-like [Cotesia glomerata]KAH0547292.1 hypothetical protein KQX54_018433 [Cotesia glomerata]